MSLTLPDAAQIRVRLAPGDALAPGQVVAFAAGRHIVAHRVLWRGRGPEARRYLLTVGDATLLPDPPVSIASVLGPVVAIAADGAWTSPAAPQLPAWRRAVRAVLVTIVAGALELSVPLASALARCLIRARRDLLAGG